MTLSSDAKTLNETNARSAQAEQMREIEYLQMIERFDQLWASATSEQDQEEMQRLIILIEQHEKKREIPAEPVNKLPEPRIQTA
ncbi:hypothetical protein [Herminiimonas arsenitoxidans]|uniref:hypothetical protein n=1 Tax=Herminiimonas arsenitoxidans TaxID=1809410 RepID=UPI0012FF8184|nr:hypothetical protein [Herminiimonas arsenitoxidans]